MSSPQIQLRELMAILIGVREAASEYEINGFTIEETYLPFENLMTLKSEYPDGKLYLITMACDQGNNKSRQPGGLAVNEIPLGIGYQKANIRPTDITLLDSCVELLDQLYRTVREFDQVDDNGNGFSWLRTEALKSDDGVPFQYTSLHNNNIFEAYFTAYFNYVVHS